MGGTAALGVFFFSRFVALVNICSFYKKWTSTRLRGFCGRLGGGDDYALDAFFCFMFFSCEKVCWRGEGFSFCGVTRTTRFAAPAFCENIT